MDRAADGSAILLTGGLLCTPYAKTAHGLLRGTRRYDVLGVVDAAHAGADAGVLLDGHHRDIPVLAGAAEAIVELRPDWAVVAVATSGGVLPEVLRGEILACLAAGVGVVNGLHQLLGDDPEVADAARAGGARVLDIRRPRPTRDLHFWSGEVTRVEALTIAVLGMDCAVGKRTTARMLVDGCRAQGVSAEMIYTGQTGWLEGWSHGFILDATPNDFVSGELEHAVVTCARETSAEVIVVEGQSSLRNPSGPCGAELVLSAGARAVVLQHAVGRAYFEGFEELGLRIPPVESEIELIRRYGAEPMAIALSGADATAPLLREEQARLRSLVEVPVVCPLEDGVDEIVAQALRLLGTARAR